MKKIIYILLITLSFTSCVTSVDLEYYTPSEVNMSNHRNIAIASTVSFDGFIQNNTYVIESPDKKIRILPSNGNMIQDSLVRNNSYNLKNTLLTGDYFNILSIQDTDYILSHYNSNDIFVQKNIDAVIIPRISSLYLEEYLTSKIVKVKDPNSLPGQDKFIDVTEYYLNQVCTLNYEYSIVDVNALSVFEHDSFSFRETIITKVDEKTTIVPNVKDIFDLMLRKANYQIVTNIMPSRAIESMILMENDPEIPSLNIAYDQINQGYLTSARDLFLSEFRQSRHIASGYNAAILTAALGDYEQSLALLGEVRRYKNDYQINEAIKIITIILSENKKALAQFNGNSNTKNSNIFDSLIK